ncbi:MAG: stage II sporulation protein R [Bacillota bacterium]
MNRKMMAGWLVLCLGVSAVVSGWLLARDARAGAPTEVAAAVPALGPDQELLRVHVIANSDSTADQALKLKVRDAVMEHLAPRLAGAGSLAEAEAVVAAALPQLEALAARLVDRSGFGYGARVELGWYDFPGKSYGELYLPAGEYKALRVVLGQGQGANFWCLLYPSFCYKIIEVQQSGPDSGSSGATTNDVIW